MDLSIVIPLYNEEESLPELYRWIRKVCESAGLTFEVIFVDDGSRDNSWQVIEKLHHDNAYIHGIRFQRNYGKSAALNTGFRAATGRVVITMDADLQDSPEEIPGLFKMITSNGFDLVSGWKKKRYDPLSKTIPTRIFNWATRRMSGISLHDFNCGLKAYSNHVIKNIEVHGEMHRYIPVIAKREGFTRIGEKIVEHRPRQYGKSKFGMERFVNGLLDLMTITFISRFGKRPMHFFGTWGLIMFFIGFVVFAWIGGYKIYALVNDIPAKNIAQQSSFFIALTAMIIGTQLFLAGFLGELISKSSHGKEEYKIQARV